MDPSMGTRNFVCVNCGSGRRTLYIQYSPGNIRLMKCESCKAVADPYIECDFMIILIDLILHKTKAYRHLLYNMLNLKAADIKGIMWKSSITYLFLDACRVFLLKKNNDWGASRSNLVSLSSWAEVLLDLLMGNIVFIGLLLLGTRVLFNDTLKTIRYEEIILAVLISSYLKMYLIAMMVWEFPSSVLFIIDIFVLSSNTVTFKVLTNGKTIKCTGICFTAHAAKFFIHYMMLSL